MARSEAEGVSTISASHLAIGNRDGAMEQYNILQNLDEDWAEKLNNLINP